MRKSKCIATLPVVLLISAIVIELTIAGVILAAFLSNTVFSSKLSSEALAAARAGAQDAIVKIIRDKNFSAPSGYSLPNISNRTSAQVTVLRDTPVVGLDEITSVGTAFLTRKKKIQ